MTTRIAQAGFELNTVGEVPLESSDTSGTTAAISNTKAKTGSRALRINLGNNGRGFAFTATDQVRGGVFLNHNGLNNLSSGIANLVRLTNTGGTNPATVRWSAATGNLELLIGGSLVASVAWTSAGMTSTDTWYHVGFTFKRHSSAGFFTVYVDGIAKLTFTGNTGSASINGVIVGGHTGSLLGFASSAYFDDLYIDDDTGGTDGAPNSPRFLWSLANGAGSNTQWTPLSSTNISNVDDPDSAAPDDDSTYNYAQAANLTDTYATTDITVPSGYSIAAVIPVAWAKKTNASIDSRISLVSYNGSTLAGTSKVLTTAYSAVWDRFETDPSSAAWTQSNFNSSETGVKSAGSF